MRSYLSITVKVLRVKNDPVHTLRKIWLFLYTFRVDMIFIYTSGENMMYTSMENVGYKIRQGQIWPLTLNYYQNLGF